MPDENHINKPDPHQDRKLKNYLLLLILLIFVVAIFSVTMIKLGTAFNKEYSPAGGQAGQNEEEQ